MRDVSRASHELRRSESKKAKLKELSSNISDRSEAKGTAILSDFLVRSPGELLVNPQHSILLTCKQHHVRLKENWHKLISSM